MVQSGVLAILSTEDLVSLANDMAQGLGERAPTIVQGNCMEAAHMLQLSGTSPRYVLIDFGTRRDSALQEIETLGAACEPGTKVVAIGSINDIQFYRSLTEHGIADYFPLPVTLGDILESFRRQSQAANKPVVASAKLGEVFGFMSASGGDGASTVALNTAFALAQQTGERTILVDMDYQFGMAARNLNLTTPYGIKDLFEHPDRGVDSTIIQRMVVPYGPLQVISAPPDLRFLPHIEPNNVADLIRTLRGSYANVVVDLPHVWQPWVASACRETTSMVLVAQLWLKSVSHAARILRACRDQSALPPDVRVVINRSGAKFKEAIEPRDFERVSGLPIAHFLTNDIKTVVDAENQAKTVIELPGQSRLKGDFENLARILKGQPPVPQDAMPSALSPLQSLFKKMG